MRFICIALLALFTFGCRSPYVETTVSNRSPTPITLLEVDYPSASFGTQNLAPGADFHYRFQVIGSGPLKLTYTDSARHDHTSTGPTLHEKAAGSLSIVITPESVEWKPAPALEATPTPAP